MLVVQPPLFTCRFMHDYDSRLDLAPRDIVARAIHEQMQSRGESHVLLDISYQPKQKILQHFPNIAAQCQGYGLDITRDPIPVAPAQHYMCGGVKVCACPSTALLHLSVWQLCLDAGSCPTSWHRTCCDSKIQRNLPL